jgi:hypothetical protein
MKSTGGNRALRWLFVAAAWVTLFTGFGNMPLYKRYYIANLPGLAWAGDFFSNVQVHYVSGSVMLMLGLFFAVSYAFDKARGVRLTPTGAVRGVILGLALLSGILMALKNLSGVHFHFGTQMFLNFLHLGMGMFFMMFALVCLFARCKWTREAVG